ncbi:MULTISPECIES: family 78 glycoside hydrolase catalytic domain [Streptomyces]|uniref:alpha-L-rhamnosidase n=1 Tax=Streptomyces caniscabiei TaxID=2746961 RepID=A0ABU4MY44_9ACTN|nr:MULTISPECIES: family 78 glycoside hydrolase catalytic domain [Streptomyces]MBE4740842.1 family 78 glycoside hydrolase catalytic domain [Streptomyces caniscabiei]MBE4760604.1 family 78 glycoside hydrolase catalytic domain [Streptomyces caniscabiei]MBE4774602.1 family 78 glycoside hydrolase catalytic domain [Streptomyces caniscabiei]MBE4788977.1 family 78 glycoside hydrolase catalytic domain [Streptomyces caniscabiei]MBE4798582.1 family 78 glycoside hydrolase catalytic domain [Streptomyces ca
MTHAPRSPRDQSLPHWTAQWIARPVPPEQRVQRAIDGDHIAWAEPGHALAQSFAASGPVTAVNLDAVRPDGENPVADIELCDESGKSLASTTVGTGHIAVWDRFTNFLAFDPPLPSGTYTLHLRAVSGRIGWRGFERGPTAVADDGVSPTPLTGTAYRDGVPEDGLRCVGVETMPAPDPVFRRRFTLGTDPSEARLYVVGLGYGHFTVNGHPVTDAVLEPAPTAYDKTVLYRAYDVSALLRRGENEIRAALGRGFFAARGGSTWGWNLAPAHREPMLLAQLEWSDTEGGSGLLVSDDIWETAAGEVVSDILYTGVTYDEAAATRASWAPAAVVPGPGGRLAPAELPPVRRFAPLEPVSATPHPTDGTVYDFGTTIAGRVALTLTSDHPGSEVVVRYGETLDANGAVFCDNILAAGEAQTDRYVTTGNGQQTCWEPEFTYKGFRYASVRVVGRGVRVDDVAAVPLHTDVERIGSFECDEPTLAWIDDATARTFLNNLHGIPTDTPVYEKNGWTADAHLATEAVLHHFDLRTTLAKWVDDHVDAQDVDGSVPTIVPTPGWGRGFDPVWSASTVLIPWNLYREYGDPRLLSRHFPALRAYADHALAIAEGAGWLWPLHSWTDWLAPGHAFAPEGAAPTGTMMVKHLADRMALISVELGEDTARSTYETASRALARAYHAAYFDSGSGYYAVPGVGYRQTLNILPLAFGAVPAEHVTTVFRSLAEDLEQRTDGHLDCGAIGVKYLPQVLSAHGRDDLAVTVLTRPARPGWDVWRQADSDTLWEAWDLDARSRNHFFLGSVSAWIQQRVGGLIATAAGWRTFDVSPLRDDRVTRADTTHRTPHGEVRAAWRRAGERWTVHVTVPAGTLATVRLPGHEPVELGAGSHEVIR